MEPENIGKWLATGFVAVLLFVCIVLALAFAYSVIDWVTH